MSREVLDEVDVMEGVNHPELQGSSAEEAADAADSGQGEAGGPASGDVLSPDVGAAGSPSSSEESDEG